MDDQSLLELGREHPSLLWLLCLRHILPNCPVSLLSVFARSRGASSIPHAVLMETWGSTVASGAVLPNEFASLGTNFISLMN